ncbi:MAG TPA: AAA family ATPase [Thermoplasmata archaeon]|nr:AAA family ATPase [Thermoplasmata archaeon]
MPAKTYVLTEILDYLDTHATTGSAFGIPQAELAQALGYHPCSMSRPLERLVGDGFLLARRSLVRGGQRRHLTYELTPTGKERLRLQTREVPMLAGDLPVPPRPFLGRKEELRQLAESCREGEGVIWVEGGPGMGKTALIAQHVRRLKRGRVPVWFTVRPGSSPRHLLETIAHALSQVGGAQLAYYAQVPRAPSGREVASLAVRALGDHRLLAILDDLQAAGKDMRAFLAEFIQPMVAQGKALFFLISQEAPFFPEEFPAPQRVVIGGLDRAAAHELTDRQGGLAERFESVYQSSLGSPLMLQLAVRTPGVEAKLSTLPDAVVAQMPPTEVNALLPVALANEPLPVAFLTEITQMTEARLEELTRVGILHPAGEGRVELLDTIRRAIVGRGRPSEMEAHRTLAEFYSRSHRSEAVRERFLHLVAGEDWRAASEVLGQEERKILSLGYTDALRNALNHMTLAMGPGASRVRAMRVLAEMLRMHSEYGDAILLLRRAMAEVEDDPKQSAEFLLLIVELFLRMHQVDSAESTLEQVRALGTPTRKLQVFFDLSVARIAEAKGDLPRAQSMFHANFKAARKARLVELGLESLASWSRLASIGGYQEEALRIVEEGLPEARLSGRADLVFNLLLVRARAYQETGKPDLAELEMRKIRSETEALGHLNQLTYTLSGLAAMTMQSEKWTEAVDFARQAGDLAERLGNETVLGHTLAIMSAGELRQGQLAPAREHGERSVRVLSRLPLSDSLVLARSYLAEVYLAVGETKLAQGEYEGAHALASSMGMSWWIQQLESELKPKIEQGTEGGSVGSASGTRRLASQAELEEGG